MGMVEPLCRTGLYVYFGGGLGPDGHAHAVACGRAGKGRRGGECKRAAFRLSATHRHHGIDRDSLPASVESGGEVHRGVDERRRCSDRLRSRRLAGYLFHQRAQRADGTALALTLADSAIRLTSEWAWI